MFCKKNILLLLNVFSVAILLAQKEKKEHIFIATANCVNEDFESSPLGTVTNSTAISGWTSLSTLNTGAGGSCYFFNGFLSQPNAVQICSNGYIDANIGAAYPIYSVFGSTPNIGGSVPLNSPIGQMYGNNFIKLNDVIPNFGAQQISKTVSVTPANALLRFAFIGVYNNPLVHACCDGGAFQVKFTQVAPTYSVIYCNDFFYNGIDTACNPVSTVNYYTFAAGTTNPGRYNAWQLSGVDLTPYIGDVIQIDFIACDCTGGAHFGYAFFDAQCGPVQIYANGLPFTGGNVPTCGTGSVTLSAPLGFAPYIWNGPPGFTPDSNQTITTSISGNYTITMGDPCFATSTVFSVNVITTPAASVTASTTNPILCLGNSSTLTATGSLINYIWNTAATTNSIVVNPTVTTVYSVSGYDANGCPATSNLTQTVSACTGIDLQSLSDNFILFPNPTSGKLTINVSNEYLGEEIIFRNLLGEEVFRHKIQNTISEVDLNSLKSGLYFAEVSLSNRIIFTRKIIKQ